jgi:hypothetical protein
LFYRSPEAWVSQLESPDGSFNHPGRDGSVTPTPSRKDRIQRKSRSLGRPSTPSPFPRTTPFTTPNASRTRLPTPTSSSATLSELEFDQLQWNYNSVGIIPLPRSFVSFFSKSVESFDPV